MTSAHVAQLAERVLGKDEVISSILIMGSMITVAMAKLENFAEEIKVVMIDKDHDDR